MRVRVNRQTLQPGMRVQGMCDAIGAACAGRLPRPRPVCSCASTFGLELFPAAASTAGAMRTSASPVYIELSSPPRNTAEEAG